MSAMESEPSIGPQKSSLRPSSARYSFASASRFGENGSPGQDSPGPGAYEPGSCLTPRLGLAGTASYTHLKQYQYQDLVDDPDAPIPDSSELRYSAPPRTIFGNAARDNEVSDMEYARAVPEHWHGKHGPGFIYTPDDRRARPSSAPSWTMRSRQSEGGSSTTSRSRAGTPSSVAPNSYRSEAAMGSQVNSRRRTSRSSSFSRSARFPAPKPRDGSLTDECKPVESAFGSQRNSRRKSGPVATFGSETRESSSRMRMSRGVADRPPSANMAKQRIPHPSVPRRQDLIRYGSRA